MTPDEFRNIVMSLPGVAEGAHMGHPDFRAGGRIFATLSADATTGMVLLTPAQQQEYVRFVSGFRSATGKWGEAGATMVDLDKVSLDDIYAALVAAWENRVKTG